MLITERVPEPVNRTRGNLVMGPLKRGSAASPIHWGLEQPVAHWAKQAYGTITLGGKSVSETMEKGIAGGALSARHHAATTTPFLGIAEDDMSDTW